MKFKDLFGRDKEPVVQAEAEIETELAIKAKAEIETEPAVKAEAEIETEPAVKAESDIERLKGLAWLAKMCICSAF